MTQRSITPTPAVPAGGPVRLRLSRQKGFDLQAHSLATNGLPAANVARPSVWGNPFVVGEPSGCEFQDGGDPTPMIAELSLAQVLEFYEDVVRGFLSPEMHPYGHRWQSEFQRRFHRTHPRDAVRSYLRGRNLACWCALDAPCHADVLLRLANPVCDALPTDPQAVPTEGVA